jgi:hypothetical protein
VGDRRSPRPSGLHNARYARRHPAERQRSRVLAEGGGVCQAPWEADAHADHKAAGGRDGRTAAANRGHSPGGGLPGDHRRRQRRAALLAAAPALDTPSRVGCRPGHRQRRRLGQTPSHVPAAFEARYDFGDGPHPHLHGENLGIRASAYLAAGGIRSLRTAEDHALLAAVTEAGCPVLQASDITVQTSAGRLARASRIQPSAADTGRAASIQRRAGRGPATRVRAADTGYRRR